MSEKADNTNIVREKLEEIIERMEEQNAVKQDATEIQKSIMQEAKTLGYDTKTIRALIQLRKKDAQTRMEEKEMMDMYMQALGME
jgi:uncharacterized protein (UPF0335 family)